MNEEEGEKKKEMMMTVMEERNGISFRCQRQQKVCGAREAISFTITPPPKILERAKSW